MMQVTDIIMIPELKDIRNVPLPASIPFGFNKLISNRFEHYHLWVRMLYSCLVDADFLDTERFMNPEQFELRGNYASLAELKNRFDRYMNEKTAHAKPSKINEVRAAILKSCREKAHLKSGFFSLNVPTGGGKTLSAMAFALEHALAHKKKELSRLFRIPVLSSRRQKFISTVPISTALLLSIKKRENIFSVKKMCLNIIRILISIKMKKKKKTIQTVRCEGKNSRPKIGMRRLS